ncbi:MAG: hypothetical protein GEV10_14550, partial [Streptosporangiales bacterium]|nr:hypothetical protein [Streptosporangiales bacterium]
YSPESPNACWPWPPGSGTTGPPASPANDHSPPTTTDQQLHGIIHLGAERPNPRTMQGRMRNKRLVDRAVLLRVFGVLGPAEAGVEMAAFTLVLIAGGWTWGITPSAGLLAVASGTAFTAVVLGQLATAFACRSESRWIGRLRLGGNRLLLGAVAVECAALLGFVGIPPVARVLGGDFPPLVGWAVAACVIPVVVLADATHKAIRAWRRRVAA